MFLANKWWIIARLRLRLWMFLVYYYKHVNASMMFQ